MHLHVKYTLIWLKFCNKYSAIIWTRLCGKAKRRLTVFLTINCLLFKSTSLKELINIFAVVWICLLYLIIHVECELVLRPLEGATSLITFKCPYRHIPFHFIKPRVTVYIIINIFLRSVDSRTKVCSLHLCILFCIEDLFCGNDTRVVSKRHIEDILKHR